MIKDFMLECQKKGQHEELIMPINYLKIRKSNNNYLRVAKNIKTIKF